MAGERTEFLSGETPSHLSLRNKAEATLAMPLIAYQGAPFPDLFLIFSNFDMIYFLK